MPRWEIGDVDQLIHETLANDNVIKSLMGISTGQARVSLYKVVRDIGYFPYIYGYCIPGPDARGQGRSRIQSNPDYDIEVRTVGAPTDASESLVDRVDILIGQMVKAITPSGHWVVSAVRRKPISMVESGESNEIYYMRRGGTYKFSIVPV